MIFVTGGTGFLGRELLRKLVVEDSESRFALLIRPSPTKSSKERERQLLEDILGKESAWKHAGRFELVEGDIELENFGLGAGEFQRLGARIDSVYHCAASTSLNQALGPARIINVGGTEQVFRLAQASRKANEVQFECFHHVSTAYVAGDTQRTVGPDDLRLDASFRNGYEQSKAEAEFLIRSQDEVHYRIYRPSIIVGDSQTGRTSAYNVIYVPARLLAQGAFQYFPAKPDAPFDLVPVDYVANAMAALRHGPKDSPCSYHLCVGLGRESSPLEILECIIRACNKYGEKLLHVPELIPPELVSRALASISLARQSVKSVEKIIRGSAKALNQTLPFLPYVTSNPRFDTSLTLAALDSTMPPPPLFRLYAERIFGYCFETNWGKLQPVPSAL